MPVMLNDRLAPLFKRGTSNRRLKAIGEDVAQALHDYFPEMEKHLAAAPETVSGTVAHPSWYMDLIMEAAVAFKSHGTEAPDDAREFAKAYTQKAPWFTTTKSGIAALMLETWLVKHGGELKDTFLETVVDNQTTFLITFIGKTPKSELERMGQQLEAYMTFQSLVDYDARDWDRHTVSDLTIMEVTPNKDFKLDAEEATKAAKSENPGQAKEDQKRQKKREVAAFNSPTYIKQSDASYVGQTYEDEGQTDSRMTILSGYGTWCVTEQDVQHGPELMPDQCIVELPEDEALYRMDENFVGVHDQVQQLLETYQDLPEEGDLFIECMLREWAEENGTQVGSPSTHGSIIEEARREFDLMSNRPLEEGEEGRGYTYMRRAVASIHERAALRALAAVPDASFETVVLKQSTVPTVDGVLEGVDEDTRLARTLARLSEAAVPAQGDDGEGEPETTDRTDEPEFYRDDVQLYYDSQLLVGFDKPKAETRTKRRFKLSKLTVTPTGEVRSPGIVDRPAAEKLPNVNPAAAMTAVGAADAQATAAATGDEEGDAGAAESVTERIRIVVNNTDAEEVEWALTKHDIVAHPKRTDDGNAYFEFEGDRKAYRRLERVLKPYAAQVMLVEAEDEPVTVLEARAKDLTRLADMVGDADLAAFVVEAEPTGLVVIPGSTDEVLAALGHDALMEKAKAVAPTHVFFDMDDTLFAFEAHYEEQFGRSFADALSTDGVEAAWKPINDAGYQWWASMPLLPGAKSLWKHAGDRAHILSAPGDDPGGTARKGKRLALIKHFKLTGKSQDDTSGGWKGGRIILSGDKAAALKKVPRAERSAYVLVDDSDKHVKAWRAMGGTAIKAKTPTQVLADLRKLDAVAESLDEGKGDKKKRKKGKKGSTGGHTAPQVGGNGIPVVIGGVAVKAHTSSAPGKAPAGSVAKVEKAVAKTSWKANKAGKWKGKYEPLEKKEAAGAVVIDDEGNILLRRPTGDFGGYKWTWPKGRVDAGEKPEQAARREVLEETGVVSRIGKRIGRYEGDVTNTTMFIAEKIKDTGRHDEETRAVVWVPPAQAASLIQTTPNKKGRVRDLKILRDAVKVMRRTGKFVISEDDEGAIEQALQEATEEATTSGSVGGFRDDVIGHVSSKPASGMPTKWTLREAEGHTHTLTLSAMERAKAMEKGKQFAKSSSQDNGHAHVVVFKDGKPVVGEAKGHRHGIVPATREGTNEDLDEAVSPTASVSVFDKRTKTATQMSMKGPKGVRLAKMHIKDQPIPSQKGMEIWVDGKPLNEDEALHEHGGACGRRSTFMRLLARGLAIENGDDPDAAMAAIEPMLEAIEPFPMWVNMRPEDEAAGRTPKEAFEAQLEDEKKREEELADPEPGSAADKVARLFCVGPYKCEAAVYECPKCKGTNGRIREAHADTGMDCMEFRCPDCKHCTEDLDDVAKVKERRFIDTRTGEEYDPFEGGSIRESVESLTESSINPCGPLDEVGTKRRVEGFSFYGEGTYETETIKAKRTFNRGKMNEYTVLTTQREVWNEADDSPRLREGKQEGFEQKIAYTPSGGYIGTPKMAHFLCNKKGIAPEVASKDHNVCSIGESTDGKWYGWSHRAIAGFGIGDRIFEEGYGDMNTPFVKHGKHPVKTKADAKKAATNFANYVS